MDGSRKTAGQFRPVAKRAIGINLTVTTGANQLRMKNVSETLHEFAATIAFLHEGRGCFGKDKASWVHVARAKTLQCSQRTNSKGAGPSRALARKWSLTPHETLLEPDLGAD